MGEIYTGGREVYMSSETRLPKVFNLLDLKCSLVVFLQMEWVLERLYQCSA